MSVFIFFVSLPGENEEGDCGSFEQPDVNRRKKKEENRKKKKEKCLRSKFLLTFLQYCICRDTSVRNRPFIRESFLLA